MHHGRKHNKTKRSFGINSLKAIGNKSISGVKTGVKDIFGFVKSGINKGSKILTMKSKTHRRKTHRRKTHRRR